MNKIFPPALVALFLLSPAFVFANSINISNVSVVSSTMAKETTPFFETKVQKISAIEGADMTLFYFSPEEIKDNSKIASWKVRFYCDKDMTMRFIDISNDSCNKAISFANSNNLPNYILFQNKNQDTKKFSFALKAYDKNGKWIHTDKNNFSWK